MKTKRGIIFAILLFGIFFCFINSNIVSAFSGDGSGTSASPYIITNCTQLNETRNNLTADYSLGNNINMSAVGCEAFQTGAGFEPIGNINNTFTGNFEGNGYNITSLYINSDASQDVGLFGYSTANIINVNLVDVVINATGNSVGGISGQAYGEISNCSFTGNITTSGGSVGGIAGYSEGIVDNCFSSGIITGNNNVGGLVGNSDSGLEISNSYSTGSVVGSRSVGGLVGNNYGTVNNSNATGDVSGDSNVGGLFGDSQGIVSNSFAIGNVTATGDEVGGLAGYLEGSIINSHATGSVISAGSDVGGLVGYIEGVITDSYASGNVTGTGDKVGGLVGWYYDGNITNSSATGNVIATGSEDGGLVGYFQSGLVNNSFATGNVTGIDYVGGLVGYTGGDVENCYATGDVNAGQELDNSYAGGLIGSCASMSTASVSKSYATGNINATGSQVGGFAGYCDSSIDSSYATGDVYSEGNWVGGLVGYNDYLINNSYATGNVFAEDEVGGLAGTAYGSVNNSYATGNATGIAYVGGLAGYFGGTIADSYSTGNASAEEGIMGGLVGTIEFGGIENSYWYNSSQGLDCYYGGNENCIAVDSEEYFYNYDNPPMNLTAGDGWDFINIWDDVLNGTDYPVFQYQNASVELDSCDGISAPTADVDEDGYIEIASCCELQLMNESLTDDYELSNSIDCSDTANWNDGAGFLPIATSGWFTGNFYGNNYTISNLYQNATSGRSGLFSLLSGSVYDIDFENLSINSTGWTTGGLVGELCGDVNEENPVISNVHSSGTVSGTSNVGGLIGINGGECGYPANIDFCSSSANVTCSSYVCGGLIGSFDDGQVNNSYATGNVNSDENYVGGLVGRAYGNISNSYATGDVIGVSIVGGFVGFSAEDISNSYATGDVTAAGNNIGGLIGDFAGNYVTNSSATGDVYLDPDSYTYNVGGLVGNNLGTIENSYATGNVNGTDDYVGGLIGYTEGNVINSYATGNINATGYSAGGLVGYSYYADISNSYATGNISSSGEQVGGLVGYLDEGGLVNNSYAIGDVIGDYVGGLVGYSLSTISNSYSTGDVTATGSYIGGLVGLNEAVISNAYWYNSTANSSLNCYNGGDENCIAISDLEYFYNYDNPPMNLTEGDGWDFGNVWDTINDTINYPVHRWRTGNIRLVDVNSVFPLNGTSSLSPINFIFNVTTSLDEQEIDYCNLTVHEPRTSEISPEADLIGLWNFEGNLEDSSGNGNDGTAYGVENFTDDSKRGDSAYYFDGDSAIRFPNESIFTSIGNFTIATWIKLDSYHTYSSIIAFGSGGDEFLIHTNSVGKLCFYNFNEVDDCGDSSLSLNRWYYIVATRAGDTASFYVNGEFDGNITGSAEPIEISAGMRNIGGDMPGGQDETLTGYLDELAIWNRSLTSEEIGDLFEESYKNSSSLIMIDINQILSLNLSEGNYTWSVSCTDDLGVIGTSETRSLTVNETATVEETSDVSESSSTSSEGGGYALQTYYTDEQFPTEQGNNFNLRFNDQIKFVVNLINHTLTLNQFNSSTAKVLIQSNPITAYLQKGIMQEFDVNGDGKNDVRARYDGINNTKAMIFIQEIVYPSNKEIVYPSNNDTQDIKKQQEVSNSLGIQSMKNNYLYLVLVLVIVIMTTIFVLVLHRHHGKRR
jgi:hypothetical protein